MSVRWYHRLWWRLAWWWGFWRRRAPRVYAHNSQLKKANDLARRVRAYGAWVEKRAPYRRRHHRDLLTGMAVAYTTGLVSRNAPGSPRRHRTHLNRRVKTTLVARPVVYEHRIELKNPFSSQPVRITRVGETEWL